MQGDCTGFGRALQTPERRADLAGWLAAGDDAAIYIYALPVPNIPRWDI